MQIPIHLSTAAMQLPLKDLHYSADLGEVFGDVVRMLLRGLREGVRALLVHVWKVFGAIWRSLLQFEDNWDMKHAMPSSLLDPKLWRTLLHFGKIAVGELIERFYPGGLPRSL